MLYVNVVLAIVVCFLVSSLLIFSRGRAPHMLSLRILIQTQPLVKVWEGLRRCNSSFLHIITWLFVLFVSISSCSTKLLALHICAVSMGGDCVVLQLD
jgi:hypothetical protein